MSAAGLSAGVSKIPWGWVSDRLSGVPVATTTLAIAALGMLAIVLVAPAGSLVGMIAVFVVWGTGFGGFLPVTELVYASYFGRRYIGAVRARSVPITLLAGSVGPVVVAMAYDASGSYDAAFIVTATLGIAAAALALLAKPPLRSVASAAA